MEKLILPRFFIIIRRNSGGLYLIKTIQKNSFHDESCLIYQFKKIQLLFSLRNLNGCQHQFVFLQLQVYGFQSAFKES